MRRGRHTNSDEALIKMSACQDAASLQQCLILPDAPVSEPDTLSTSRFQLFEVSLTLGWVGLALLSGELLICGVCVRTKEKTEA